MIKIIEVESSMFVDATKKIIRCPFCKKEMFFYNTSPEKCSGCKSDLLDYINMLNNSNYKLNYHFGVVNEAGVVCVYI